MRWAILAFVLISVLGIIPGMGIPGALVLTCTEWDVAPVLKLFGVEFNIMTGDRAWPAAIFMTTVSAFGFIPAKWAAGKYPGMCRQGPILVGVLVYAAWCIAATFFLQLTNR